MWNVLRHHANDTCGNMFHSPFESSRLNIAAMHLTAYVSNACSVWRSTRTIEMISVIQILGVSKVPRALHASNVFSKLVHGLYSMTWPASRGLKFWIWVQMCYAQHGHPGKLLQCVGSHTRVGHYFEGLEAVCELYLQGSGPLKAGRQDSPRSVGSYVVDRLRICVRTVWRACCRLDRITADLSKLQKADRPRQFSSSRAHPSLEGT